MSASRPVLLALVLVFVLAPRMAAPQGVAITPEQMAVFLTKAAIVRERTTSDGITRPVRATLSDGVLTHDAQFQTVDQARAVFEAGKASEVDFKDTYRYNIAGYRLAQMVGLETVPMSVERNYKGKSAAVTWWIDDAMMESDRKAKKLESQDPEGWNKQMYAVRVFNQLIYNVDANLTNILITKDWNIWMIDHTRAFRLYRTCPKLAGMKQIDRTLLENLKKLNKADLKSELSQYLTPMEIDGVLARRDAIVKHFGVRMAENGEAKVLYQMASR